MTTHCLSCQVHDQDGNRIEPDTFDTTDHPTHKFDRLMTFDGFSFDWDSGWVRDVLITFCPDCKETFGITADGRPLSSR